MSKRFRGTYTVMITPFDALGAVNYKALADFTEWQIESGIAGLIPLGSTGEFLSLTEEERHGVARTVIDTAAGRVPVLIGTGHEWTDQVIAESRAAEAMGADGVMIIPPFYSTPTEDELFAHYKAIGEAVSIPIMVYNNPATANVDLTPPILKRLSAIDNVRYVKESTMDVTRVRDIIDLCGEDMIVFGGIMGFESFVNGAQGWVAVGSNVMPAEFAELFTLTADAQDYDAARALYRRILPVIRMVGGHHYVSATKAALELMGHDVGGPRGPRLPVGPAGRVAIARTLAELGLQPLRASA
ncbi:MULTISPECIES: dihydrodipicolinate synthase family protein [unclassified Roseitalea]|uniref:dihydrodipicolinate synthase family protein n=1 Tax=unclassified Roseitalea TaxID=2639107 RepID=UPI00273ECF2C|nr:MULTISPECIES: dihydrodipicolinate synthase family protein [unclassified Roseitalea]